VYISLVAEKQPLATEGSQVLKQGKLIVVVLLIALCKASAVAAVIIKTVPLPAGGIHPQVCTDSRQRAHVIYFKGDPRAGDIYYTRSDDGGKTFTTPQRVNSQPGSAMIIGTVRGPHLAVGKDDRIHVAWMGSEATKSAVEGKQIPMLYTRLNDARDGFEPQRNLIHQHYGLDGGGAIAADKEGNVYVAWHAPGTEGKHAEADRQVWIARSRDDGTTFEPETLAFDKKVGVCACCGMNAFAASDGRVSIVFRAATANVNRDIYVLASKDQGQTFSVMITDPWKIGTCVMSTASFGEVNGSVLAAWETKKHVQFGRFSYDAEKTLAPVTMPGTGVDQKHPSVAGNGRGVVIVAWADGAGWEKGGWLTWQAFDAEGQPLDGEGGKLVELNPWSLPAVFAAPDGSFRIMH
jgi:hypothetical protein